MNKTHAQNLAAFLLALLIALPTAMKAADPPSRNGVVPSSPVIPRPKVVLIAPTLSDVPYGEHPRQVLDFYRADSNAPTPVVLYIHGGGWLGGSKSPFNAKPYLDRKISVVAVGYRFTSDAGDLKPPVKAPLDDAARAVQFVRTRAAEWNIDKVRIGATGGSAGGFSCLWLAFHDNMSDPSASDPAARESTRLYCVGVSSAQTTLDPKQMCEWIPNINGGAHAFGFTGNREKKLSPFSQFLQARDAILPWIKEYSPYELLTADDPPVGLYYGGVPELGKAQPDPLHTANFGLGLQEKCKHVGVECELYYEGAPDIRHRTVQGYLIDKLTAKK